MSSSEFYDLRKDPKEMVNACRNPEYAAVISEWKAELKCQREALKETDARYSRPRKIIEEHRAE